MESFLALRRRTSTLRNLKTVEEFRIAIVTWIERTYHRPYRQDALGWLTTVEYEAIITPASIKAA
jgi:transposase InsO family protein